MSTLRSRLISHTAKRIYLWFFAAVFASTIALRAEAAIRARRIASVVTALSTLRIGETSRAETLRRIPGLRPRKTNPEARCDADECFYGSVAIDLPGRVLWSTQNEALSNVLRWLGFRAEGFAMGVNFTSGRVSYLEYHLMVSAPGVPAAMPPPPPDGKLGVLVIGLGSEKMITVTGTRQSKHIHPI